MSALVARHDAEKEAARNARLRYFDARTSASSELRPSTQGTTTATAATDRLQKLRRLERMIPKPPSSSPWVPQDQSLDDEERELNAALALSLRPFAEQAPSRASAQQAPVASNSLWSPPRYMPRTDTQANKTLRLVELVQVRDGGYAWQQASAFLDTGNQHMTIIDDDFAAMHGIHIPVSTPGSVFSQAERYTTIRGVVPGATTRVPVVTIALRIRGHDFTIQAAVSKMHGHTLLLGIDVLQNLFAAGFNISAGSV